MYQKCLTNTQIDTNNAASIRVLQMGQPNNIMIELGMSSDEYNWVASIYGVSLELTPVSGGTDHLPLPRFPMSSLKRQTGDDNVSKSLLLPIINTSLMLKSGS